MTAAAAPAAPGMAAELASAIRALGGAALALVAGLLVLGFIFQREVLAAVQVWDASTAYNHCYLILPITLYMIWDRREVLYGLRPEPLPMVALAVLPVTVVWLVAERLGIMEGRQLMAVTVMQILFLAVLGWRICWALCGPLLYLYFLVPFGEFLVPRLQDITAVFIRFGMGFTGIPAFIDGYTIEIPEGTFYVAEACAGLRFLIASIAFGVLYALLMYRSPVRRSVFIAISIIVPIIANGFRALGIVVLGHVLGSAEAAAADHIIYGWVFFSVVILLLIAIGLPFREDLTARAPSPPPPVPQDDHGFPTPARAAIAAVGVVALALASPGAVWALDSMAAANVPPVRPLTPADGCTVLSAEELPPTRGAFRSAQTRVACAGMGYDITVVAFSPRITAGPVVTERRRLTREPKAEDVSEFPIGEGPVVWRLVKSADPFSVAAVGMWIDGLPSGSGLGVRVALAKASLLGSNSAPVVVAVRPVFDWTGSNAQQRRIAEGALVQFLTTQSDLADQAGALSRLGR